MMRAGMNFIDRCRTSKAKMSLPLDQTRTPKHQLASVTGMNISSCSRRLCGLRARHTGRTVSRQSSDTIICSILRYLVKPYQEISSLLISDAEALSHPAT